jgi:hypothetical protein
VESEGSLCDLSLPPERKLLSRLFHRRFEAKNGLKAVQAGLRVTQPPT